MRSKHVLAGIGTTAVLAAMPVCVTAATAAPMPAALAVGVLTADYEMNEPVGSTVMTDSSGNGLNGAIVASTQITTGWVNYDGAIGYHWLRRPPNEPPASPERVIQVPDHINLEPGASTVTFTIELRFRTSNKFGNIAQKGQATTRGGQWKIQNPLGRPSCLFKGSAGRVSTRVPTALNDNLWHVLTCVRTPTRVTALVDGVEVNYQNGSTGTIDNAIPMTVGGKINCDQIQVTCDYFSGDIDYIRLYKG
jgi:hypothetical protein